MIPIGIINIANKYCIAIKQEYVKKYYFDKN